MARAKRHIMLLSDQVAAERQLIELLDAVPAGNEAAFVRGLVMLGFKDTRDARPADEAKRGTNGE